MCSFLLQGLCQYVQTRGFHKSGQTFVGPRTERAEFSKSAMAAPQNHILENKKNNNSFFAVVTYGIHFVLRDGRKLKEKL